MKKEISSLARFIPGHIRGPFPNPRKLKAFESVSNLEKSMYMVLDGYILVRLLNLSGKIGCANPGLDKVVAPIVRFKNDIEVVRSTTILVPLYDFDRLLSRHSRKPWSKFMNADNQHLVSPEAFTFWINFFAMTIKIGSQQKKQWWC